MEGKEVSIQHILKGEIIAHPEYKEQKISGYKNNPCIEALPEIFDDEFLIRKIAFYPEISESEKMNNGNVRYHLIKQIKNYYQPLSIHLKIEHTLSCVIRRSYIARNPSSNEYLMRLRLIAEVIEEQKENKLLSSYDICNSLCNKFNSIPETNRSSAECFSIIGISGMGKSTAIEKLLLMYPQVIIHREYKGNPLTRTQIVWLKIDCPYDGSLKTLCKMFFKALDDVLLTTNYFKRYGNNRVSTATMMIHMSHLASLHSIGVLVIDEMQHLINPKNKPDEILNFLVTLINMIGISVIQIGTPKVTSVLTKGFRELRRAEESGCIFWDRMKEDEEWDFFINNLWECQVLKIFTPLTDEFKQAMYYETQGITSITINLFILIQAQAIFNTKEKITENLIHSVAKNDLRLTNKVIDALRSNRIDEIASYEDISIEIEDILQNKMRDYEYQKRIEELSIKHKQSIASNKKNLKESVLTEIVSMGIFMLVDYKKLEKIFDQIIKKEPSPLNKLTIKQKLIIEAIKEEEILFKDDKGSKESTNKKNFNDKEDLRYLFDKAKKENKHIYEVLKDNGYIKDPLKEFYKYDI
ncbi:ATP-binding protein [Clostridium sp. Sa3CVN1]|uniref:ATP-binding protein n=1 Tax=Clostridium cibarium TaxID=2762247 RepID=A0ABR8PUX2_9CLOT|nr:ATP-binding protein [Clostridium cibarium]MBD7911970.1 ATP-binding protein [Clostridium cibarium]